MKNNEKRNKFKEVFGTRLVNASGAPQHCARRHLVSQHFATLGRFQHCAIKHLVFQHFALRHPVFQHFATFALCTYDLRS